VHDETARVATAVPMLRRAQVFVDGDFVDAHGPFRDVEDPRTGAVVAQVRDASQADVDSAVAAASRAAPMWSSSGPDVRANALDRLADCLNERAQDLAHLVECEQGAPAPLARKLHVDLAIDVVRGTARALREVTWEQRVDNSVVRREAVGVVAAVTPWNLPLYQVVVKVAPALAAGCTVVLKPSELTPLSAIALAGAVRDSEFPKGVFNVVSGGRSIGTHLTTHRSVDLVSFTGSTSTGRLIAAQAAGDLKRVVLELGGKSPSILLPGSTDNQFVTALKVTLGNCFLNGGQTCTALSRLLIPEDRLDEAKQHLRKLALRYVPGERMGPLISADQKVRVLANIEQGISAGATRLVGEPDINVPGKGHYVAPTVFTEVRPDMAIAQEEIFGPVLSVLTYKSVDEAIDIANGTEYGLTAAVWGADAETVEYVAARVEAGQIDVNGAAFNVRAPFGGFKHSGVGRELGEDGILACTEVKSIQT